MPPPLIAPLSNNKISLVPPHCPHCLTITYLYYPQQSTCSITCWSWSPTTGSMFTKPSLIASSQIPTFWTTFAHWKLVITLKFQTESQHKLKRDTSHSTRDVSRVIHHGTSTTATTLLSWLCSVTLFKVTFTAEVWSGILIMNLFFKQR